MRPADYFGEAYSGFSVDELRRGFRIRRFAGPRRVRTVRKEVLRDLPERRPLRNPNSPVGITDVELTDLSHEPVYQLVRQQLLAAELERDAGVKADLVTVVHVLSPDNLAYQKSFIPPALRGRGATASEVWASLLRAPDRFIGLDPAVFSDPAITSDEYARRHGGD